MDRDFLQAKHAVDRSGGQQRYVPQVTREGYNNNSAKLNAMTSSPFASTADESYRYYDSLMTKYQNKTQKIRTDRLRFVGRNDEQD
jgi:hypothetical protein